MNRHERRSGKAARRRASPKMGVIEVVSNVPMIARDGGPVPEAKIVVCEDGDGGVDMFFVIDGQKVAKRGHPGTPQAKQWIPLIPELSIQDIQITEENTNVH